MKTLAFVFGLCIGAVGTVGIVVPTSLVWLAQQFDTSVAFYALAMVRISFGVVLISAAPDSRAPTGLHVLGYVILILGITTALTGLVGIAQARAAIDWWLHQGPGVVRLTGVPVLTLGAFVAGTCAPRSVNRALLCALLVAFGVQVREQTPFVTKLEGSSWRVHGTLPEGAMGPHRR